MGVAAVKEMALLINSSVKEIHLKEETFGTLERELDQNIPGVNYLFHLFTLHINDSWEALSGAVRSFIEQSIDNELTISHPYLIIQGEVDAVTTLIDSTIRSKLTTFVATSLKENYAQQASEVWTHLQHIVDIYQRSHAYLLHQEYEPQVVDSPFLLISEQYVNLLFLEMAKQEALIRTMAPAYDDSLITLFER